MLKARNVDILHGNLFKNIFLFALPLILTNLLQILFNLSDLMVVGKFSPNAEPLGSVGSTSILVSLVTYFLIGLGSGINSLVSSSIGAKDFEKCRKQIANSFVFVLFAGVFISLLVIGVSDSALRLLNTPEKLFDGALNYLRIYAAGFVATAIFNFGNAVLSANGETKMPLFFLAASGIINVGLNFLFVCGFHLYAEGVGIASTISQCIAASLVLIHLFRRKDYLKLSLHDFRFDNEIQKDIMRLGLVSGLQNSIYYIANLFLQWQVNSYGEVMVEGNTAALNIDNVIYDTMAGFYVACCTFIAQNKGAKQWDRVKNAYWISILYSGGIALALGALAYCFRGFFLGLFTSDPEVIKAGEIRLTVMALSNCLSAFMDGTTAASRGLGKTRIPTVFVLIGALLFRIVWIFAVANVLRNPYILYLMYPISFVLTSALEMPYFFYVYRKESAIEVPAAD